MGEVKACTLSRVNELKNFILELTIESRKQRYIAIVCGIIACSVAIVEVNSISAIPFSVVALFLGSIFLILLFVSMSYAEKSLSEFHDLILSGDFLVEDHYEVSNHELRHLEMFIRQAKRFIALYCVLRILNWIVFLVSIATVLYEVSYLIP